MKIVKPSHVHLTHDCTPYEFIEKIGRTCYKSTDKITPGSAEKFVNNLISRGHWAMIEHENAYFVLKSVNTYINLLDELHMVGVGTQFLKISEGKDERFAVSGNLRAFYDAFIALQNNYKNWRESTLMQFYLLLSDIFPDVFSSIELSTIKPDYAHVILMGRQEFVQQFKDEPDVLMKHLTHSVLFTCDRGVSHELVRHRPVSFAQESTRYCNYAQDKFGKEITVIEPFFYKDREQSEEYNMWERAMEDAERHYFELIDAGSTPQEARSVLPNSLKTEIIMTATEEEWQHIIDLRAKGTTGKPHPQMVELMQPWYKELQSITEGRIK